MDCLAFQFSSIFITYFHPPLNSLSHHHSTSVQILIALSLPESLSLSDRTGEKNLSKIQSYKEVWLWSLSRKARVLYSRPSVPEVSLTSAQLNTSSLSQHLHTCKGCLCYIQSLLLLYLINTSTLNAFPFPPSKSLQSLFSPNVTSLQLSRIQFEQYDSATRTRVNWDWVEGREAEADEWQVYINKITSWKPQDNYCFYAEILAGQLW